MNEPLQPSNRRPVHPGEVLLYEFMVPNDLTIAATAAKAGIDPEQLRGIVCNEEHVSGAIAEKLAAAFGTTDAFWRNLQARYDAALCDEETIP